VKLDGIYFEAEYI